MVPNNIETFEEFLAKSFGDGVYSQELRLSREEAGYVLTKYPKARLKKSVTAATSDEKIWYEINLPTPISVAEKSVNENEFAAIQTENLRLKQELERVKRSLANVDK
jgi:hypothetical protein